MRLYQIREWLQNLFIAESVCCSTAAIRQRNYKQLFVVLVIINWQYTITRLALMLFHNRSDMMNTKYSLMLNERTFTK